MSDRERLAAALDLFELSVEALYKKYYSQPEYGVPKVCEKQWQACADLQQLWPLWDSSGVVYSPAFRAELLETVLERSDTVKASQAKGGTVAPFVREFQPGYLLGYFDANGLKELNDSLSHLVGNEAIRAVGRWLHDAFWTQPVGQDGQSLADGGKLHVRAWVIRVAGDEFEVIIAFPVGSAGGQPATGDPAKAWEKAIRSQVTSFIGKTPSPHDELFRGLAALHAQLLPSNTRAREQSTDISCFGPVRKLGIAGGIYLNMGSNGVDLVDHDIAFKHAERAMYEAKSIMKSRRVKQEAESRGVEIPQVLCLLHDEAERVFEAVRTCVPSFQEQ
jgi:GGDEF domain-containing protein